MLLQPFWGYSYVFIDKFGEYSSRACANLCEEAKEHIGSVVECLTGGSCRTATLYFFFDLAESKVAVFLCSILTSDGVPFSFGKNSFP